MAQAQATHNTITLKGSTKIVTEFFAYAVNSILYQRGIYPPDNFEQRKQYGLSIMVSTDTGLTDYLSTVLEQMSDWLVRGELQKMVLVITSSETKETLERWTFDLQTDKSVVDGRSAPEKSDKEITSEIQAIIRQITASVTFLPLLNDACTFDLLVYTDAASSVPTEWEDSDPRFIQNAADVKLRSFTTKVHKVDALVSYRADDD
ncbi:hypothetical protein WJX82_001946 [Trebouxia sp. C0006]